MKSHTIKILVRSRKSHRSRKIPEKSLKKKESLGNFLGYYWRNLGKVFLKSGKIPRKTQNPEKNQSKLNHKGSWWISK